MLEVCIDSLQSSINAIHGGADELEVCSSLVEGGLTPSPGLVAEIVKMVNNIHNKLPMHGSCSNCNCFSIKQKPKINIMIRCRIGSDFCYDQTEMDTMLSDITFYKAMEIDRFVFGALDKNQAVDENVCKRVIKHCSPVPVTFHRAYDMCADPLQSLDKIIKLGFDRVLTSGQCHSADEEHALKLIKDLQMKYNSSIQIMPGAGVNAGNCKKFLDIGCKIVHSSCKMIKKLPQVERSLSMGAKCDYYIFETNEENVKNIKDIINLV